MPEIKRVAVVGDVRNRDQLDYVMRTYPPDCVFHAAALKHVPLCEYNPDQAVLTNILGTQNVVDACIAHHVPLMVQISTDKSVNPISVMGATKRVAELYFQSRAQESEGVTTRFVTVRFGNVLNSAGSVVPLFTRQIARGGPVTITHPEMTRYFMTIAEAVELVLQAAALDTYTSNQSSAQARIYVLEMGDPVSIEALARQMIRLSGRKPGVDIEITYTGLRPGEKLYEELFHANEKLVETTHPSIRLADARDVTSETISKTISDIISAARRNDNLAIKTGLRVLVPEFTPDTN
jgi:O-antigen biosynthesis protein WbqV